MIHELSDDRGAVTVEAALALGTLTAFLALAIAALLAVDRSVRCTDAARELARLAARGEPDRGREVAAELAPLGARLDLTSDGDLLVATVTAPLVAPLPVTIGGRAVAARERGGPGTADPGTADPGTADPGTADPGTADPGTADPGTADPGTADPGAADQGPADPGAADQGPADTGVIDSGTAGPRTAGLRAAGSGPADSGAPGSGTATSGQAGAGTAGPSAVDLAVAGPASPVRPRRGTVRGPPARRPAAGPCGIGHVPDGDGGAATVWAAGAVAILLVVLVAGLHLGSAVVARHRAESAADLAALAAAAHAIEGEERACAAARVIAGRAGADVLSCHLDGWDALVEARVPLPFALPGTGAATGRARAGPGP